MRNPGDDNKAPPISFELPERIATGRVAREIAFRAQWLSIRFLRQLLLPRCGDDRRVRRQQRLVWTQLRGPDLFALHPSAAVRNETPTRPSPPKPPTPADSLENRE